MLSETDDDIDAQLCCLFYVFGTQMGLFGYPLQFWCVFSWSKDLELIKWGTVLLPLYVFGLPSLEALVSIISSSMIQLSSEP